MRFRHTKYSVDRNGAIRNTKTGHTLTPVRKPSGYYEVRLSIAGKMYYLSHHRLVWEAHYGNIPASLQIHHKDDDKSNNQIENLELVTHGQNQERRKLRWGTAVNTSKLSENDVYTIRKKLSQKERVAKIADDYGVHITTIYRIKNGRSWAKL